MTTADAPSITCRTSNVFAATLLPDPELPTMTALWFGLLQIDRYAGAPVS